MGELALPRISRRASIVPLPDRPSGLEPGGGGRQSKSRRTTGRQAKGRPGASDSGLAGGQGVPLTGRPSGPTPGATAGSQSPGGPRADKPRVGWVTGRASAHSWPAGKHSAPPGPGTHPGRGGRQSASHGPAAGPGGLAPLEAAGGRGAPHPDRSPGPKIRGGGRAEAEFGSCSATGKGRGHRPGPAHVQTRMVVRAT